MALYRDKSSFLDAKLLQWSFLLKLNFRCISGYLCVKIGVIRVHIYGEQMDSHPRPMNSEKETSARDVSDPVLTSNNIMSEHGLDSGPPTVCQSVQPLVFTTYCKYDSPNLEVLDY